MLMRLWLSLSLAIFHVSYGRVLRASKSKTFWHPTQLAAMLLIGVLLLIVAGLAMIEMHQKVLANIQVADSKVNNSLLPDDSEYPSNEAVLASEKTEHANNNAIWNALVACLVVLLFTCITFFAVKHVVTSHGKLDDSIDFSNDPDLNPDPKSFTDSDIPGDLESSADAHTSERNNSSSEESDGNVNLFEDTNLFETSEGSES